MSLDQSISDNDRRSLRNSDDEDQFNNLSAKVSWIYAPLELALHNFIEAVTHGEWICCAGIYPG